MFCGSAVPKGRSEQVFSDTYSLIEKMTHERFCGWFSTLGRFTQYI
jgi:hypothetical protein